MTSGSDPADGNDNGADRTTTVRGPGLPSVPGVRLDKEIGRGGFATVYRGHQISVDRDVAVKVDTRRLADARDRRRFTREIVAAGSVSAHPHIVTIYDGGITADDHPYLVMELYSGGSYADKIRAHGPIAIPEVLDVGFAIADALVAAHGEGILHRDVKPGNILISRYGSPALADFGLAALPPGGDGYSVTMESLTPSYAAPEAFGGSEPTVGMDIYALGATLYALLQGRPPRSDPSGSSPPIAKLLLLLNEPLPAVGGPEAEDLMTVIWRATSPVPGERYPTAAALRDALAAVRGGHPGAAGGLRPLLSRPASGDPDPSVRRGATPTSTLLPLLPTGEEPSTGAPEPARATGGGRRWVVLAVAALVAALIVVGAVLVGGHVRLSGQPTRVAGVVASSATTAPPTTPSTGHSGTTPVTPSILPPTTRGSVFPPVTATHPGTPQSTPTTAPTTSSGAASGSTGPVKPPAVGTCFAGMVEVGDHISAASVSSCSQPHYWETYATGILASSTATPYTSDLAKDAVVKATCTQSALAAYLGSAGHGTFDTDVIPPTDVDFLQGRKGFYCVAARHDAGEVTGSLRAG